MFSLQVNDKNGTVMLVETPEPHSLEVAQRIVGGYVEPAFTFRSPVPNKTGRCISAYVNEDGLSLQLPLTAIIELEGTQDESGRPYRSGVAGNIVFTAFNDSDGEAVELKPEEITFLKNRIKFSVTHPLVLISVPHS